MDHAISPNLPQRVDGTASTSINDFPKKIIPISDSVQTAGTSDLKVTVYDTTANAPVFTPPKEAVPFDRDTTRELAEQAYNDILASIDPRLALTILSKQDDAFYAGVDIALETASNAEVWATSQMEHRRVSNAALMDSVVRTVGDLHDEIDELSDFALSQDHPSLADILKKISDVLEYAKEMLQATRVADHAAFSKSVEALGKTALAVVHCYEEFIKIQEYLKKMWLSLDFMSNPEKYKKMMAFMDKHPEAGMGSVDGDWSKVYNEMFLDALKSILLPIRKADDNLDEDSAEAIAKTIALLLRLLLANLRGLNKDMAKELMGVLKTLSSELPTSMVELKPQLQKSIEQLRLIAKAETTDTAALSSVPTSQLNQQMTTNLSAVLSGLRRNVLAELDHLDANSSTPHAMNNYLKQIAEAIASAQQYLLRLQTADAESSAKTTAAQRDMGLAQLGATLGMVNKAEQMRKKQETTGLLFKILGPIVAVAFLVGTVASGGATIAALAIAVTSVALSIADSATGFMSKGFETMISGLADWFKEMGCDQTAAQMMAVVAMVLMIAVIAVAAKGAAAKLGTGIVKNAGEVAGQQAIGNVSKSVSFQVAATLITSSQVIFKFNRDMFEAMGVDKDTAEIIGQVVQMIALMALMIAAGKSLSPDARQIVSKAIEKSVKAMQYVVDTGQVGINLASAIMHFQLAGLALDKANLQASIEEFTAALDVLDKGRKKMSDSMVQMSESMQNLSQLFNSVINEQKRIVTNITRSAA